MRTQHPEEDQEPLLERIRLEYQRADLEVKIGHLEADVAYPWSDYLFLNEGAKKDALFVESVVRTVKLSSSRPSWLLVNSQLSYFKTVLGVETSRVSINLWCAILFFSCSVLAGLCFEVSAEFLFGYAVLIKC